MRSTSSSSTHLYTENRFGVTLQRAQEQAAPGVPHADGAVVGAEQQQAVAAFLGRAQAAHSSRPVALKHIQRLQSLGIREATSEWMDRWRGKRRRRHDKSQLTFKSKLATDPLASPANSTFQALCKHKTLSDKENTSRQLWVWM